MSVPCKEKIMKREIIAAALSLSFCGCGVRPNEKTIQAIADNDGNLGITTLPNGAVADGPEEYGAAIANEVPPIDEMSTYELTVQPSADTSGAGGIKLGKFRIRIAPDIGYLEGCIRHSFLHLKVMVTSDGVTTEPFVELHLVAWFDSGAPCLAVMNTGFVGYGWCQKFCYKDAKKNLTQAIAGGLIAAGVGASVAKVSSYLIAPVAAAAFAM
jgi:hypothetical protein